MSFHTEVWVQSLDGEVLEVSTVRRELIVYLDENSLSHDTLKSISEACAPDLHALTNTLFYLDSWSIIALFTTLAVYLPNRNFAVRGVGEDPRDIWTREFSNGMVTFEAGPFNE